MRVLLIFVMTVIIDAYVTQGPVLFTFKILHKVIISTEANTCRSPLQIFQMNI